MSPSRIRLSSVSLLCLAGSAIFASELEAQCQAVPATFSSLQGIEAGGTSTVTVYVESGDGTSVPASFLGALNHATGNWSSTCGSQPNVPTFEVKAGDRDADPNAPPGSIQVDWYGDGFPQHDAEENFWKTADHDSTTNSIRVFGRCPNDSSFPTAELCDPAGRMTWSSQGDAYGTKAMTHEIGHAFGLGHDTCDNSVMNQVLELTELGGALLTEHCDLANALSEPEEDPGPVPEHTVSITVTGLTAAETAFFSLVGHRPGGTVLSEGMLVVGSQTNPVALPQQIPEGSTYTATLTLVNNPEKHCDAISGGTGTITGDTVIAFACACDPTSADDQAENLSLGPKETENACDVVDPIRKLQDHCGRVPATCYVGDEGSGVAYWSTQCWRVTESWFEPTEVDGGTFFDVLHIFETTACKSGFVVYSTTGPEAPGSPLVPRADGQDEGNGPIVGIIEPQEGEALSGTVQIRGLARDDAFGTAQVALWIDNEPAPVTGLVWGQPLPGGCVDLPAAPASSCNPNMGWSATLDTRLLENGPHRLQVVAVSGRGDAWPPVTYGEQSFQVSNCGDSKYPEVSLDQPLAGSYLKGVVTVGGAASDNVKVTEVQLLVDSQVKASDQTAPWTFTWDSATKPDGQHDLRLRASDACGNWGYSPIKPVIVDNTKPSLAITAPSAGATLSGTVQVTASASDANGVDRVSFYVDGVLQGTDHSSPYAFSLNTASWPDGDHQLKVWTVDPAGNGRSVPINVTFGQDSQSPQVGWIKPAVGSFVRGNVTLEASATDDQAVEYVQFHVDGAVIATDSAPPYRVTWSTTGYSDGPHSLRAKAVDGAGKVAITNAVPVTVDNTAPNLHVDRPYNWQVVAGGSVWISGWSIDASSVAAHTFKIDGQPLPLNGPIASNYRLDACNAYPGIPDPDCPYVGWQAYFDSTRFSNGSHTLTVTAIDAAGNTKAFNRSFRIQNVYTVSFHPVADATARQEMPNYVDGGSTLLGVRTTDGGRGRYSFLKFQVSGVSGQVTSARLLVRTASNMTDLWLYWLVHSNWTESNLSWNYFPSPGGDLDHHYNLYGQTWYSFDVSGYVSGSGTYSMGFANSNWNDSYLWSRESTDPPVLEVTYVP